MKLRWSAQSLRELEAIIGLQASGRPDLSGWPQDQRRDGRGWRGLGVSQVQPRSEVAGAGAPGTGAGQGAVGAAARSAGAALGVAEDAEEEVTGSPLARMRSVEPAVIHADTLFSCKHWILTLHPRQSRNARPARPAREGVA